MSPLNLSKHVVARAEENTHSSQRQFRWLCRCQVESAMSVLQSCTSPLSISAKVAALRVPEQMLAEAELMT